MSLSLPTFPFQSPEGLNWAPTDRLVPCLHFFWSQITHTVLDTCKKKKIQKNLWESHHLKGICCFALKPCDLCDVPGAILRTITSGYYGQFLTKPFLITLGQCLISFQSCRVTHGLDLWPYTNWLHLLCFCLCRMKQERGSDHSGQGTVHQTQVTEHNSLQAPHLIRYLQMVLSCHSSEDRASTQDVDLSPAWGNRATTSSWIPVSGSKFRNKQVCSGLNAGPHLEVQESSAVSSLICTIRIWPLEPNLGIHREEGTCSLHCLYQGKLLTKQPLLAASYMFVLFVRFLIILNI